MTKRHEFTASVWQEDDGYIAQCLEVDVASQGGSKEEALNNLVEALELHFEEPTATSFPRTYPIEVELATA